MPVRSFDGVDDFIDVQGTPETPFSDAYSVVLVCKPLTDPASSDAVMTMRDDMSSLGGFEFMSAIRIAWYDPSFNATSPAFTSTDNSWQTIALTKAATSGQGKMHQKPLTGGTWDHNFGGDTYTANAQTLNGVRFGNGFQPTDILLAAAAIIDLNLLDSEIESFNTALATQRFIELGAIHVWDFNQANVGEFVLDLVGDWHQSDMAGTTVVTNDEPPWSFGAGVGTPVPVSAVSKPNGSATSMTVTLTSDVPAGQHCVIAGSFWANASVTSASDDGPGNTWAIDNTADVSGNPQGWFVRDDGTGIPAGTIITINFNISADGRVARAFRIPGIDTGSPVVTSGSTGASTAPNWAGSSLSVAAGNGLLTTAYNESGVNGTNTPSAGVEYTDDADVYGNGFVVQFRNGSGASINNAGAWGSAGAGGFVGTASVVYKAAVGGGPPPASPVVEPDYSRFPKYKLRRAPAWA